MDIRSKLKSLVQKGEKNSTGQAKNHHHHVPKSLSFGNLDLRRSSKSSPTSSRSLRTHSISNHDINGLQDSHAQLYVKYKMEKEIRGSTQRKEQTSREAEEHTKQVLASIEPLFFEQQESFVCEDYIVKRLPDVLDIDYLITEKNRLKKQLSVVSKKVTDLMMTHQSAYFNELQKVIQLQVILNNCINTCSRSRTCLSVSKVGLSTRQLKMITDFKRRQNLLLLLDEIAKLKDSWTSERQQEEGESEEEPIKGSNSPPESTITIPPPLPVETSVNQLPVS